MRSSEAYAVVYLNWAFQYHQIRDPARIFTTKAQTSQPEWQLTLDPKKIELVWDVVRLSAPVLSAEAAVLR